MHQNPADQQIRSLLSEIDTVAVAGASDKQHRPVYRVMAFLQQHGIRCIPVNPRLAGRQVLGETAFARLTDLPAAVDMVDCFIAPERVGPVVDDAIAIGAKVIWMQLGVVNEAVAARAAAAGLTVVMDRCPAIEWRRLGIDRQADADAK